MTNKVRLADELGGICEVGGCDGITTSIVYSRTRRAVILCCNDHAFTVADEGRPEYHHICQNCECELPIN